MKENTLPQDSDAEPSATESNGAAGRPTSGPGAKPGAKGDPLHGVTLEKMLDRMVTRYGWDEMADRIPIKCFQINPSIKSSLAFLRKTPWARKKLEDWYAYTARRFDMDTDG
ncbi:MAG: VF530 family protein [Pirellulales bacterium]